MTIPELRRLHSPDLLDMRAGTPADPQNFRMLVQGFIGSKGDPGEDSFDFLVCTPQYISEVLGRQRAMFARHYLIVDRYDYELIWNAIAGLCQRTSGATWQEVAERLAKYGHWEFEDYRPYPVDSASS